MSVEAAFRVEHKKKIKRVKRSFDTATFRCTYSLRTNGVSEQRINERAHIYYLRPSVCQIKLYYENMRNDRKKIAFQKKFALQLQTFEPSFGRTSRGDARAHQKKPLVYVV